MLALDVMTPDPICCTTSTKLAEAARLMATNDCGALPVVDVQSSRFAIGIVTDRDIICRTLAIGRDPMQLTVAECLSAPCVTVSKEATVAECCDSMEANRIRRLVVTDGEGRVVGIISQADLARNAPELKTAEVLRELSLRADALKSTF